MYRYTRYRDCIELIKQLNDLINPDLLPDNVSSYPGRTALSAAHKIQIDQEFTFELSDCHVLFNRSEQENLLYPR
jgi:hypothetical protein